MQRRSQTRFLTEQQITERIDAKLAQAAELLRLSVEAEARAKAAAREVARLEAGTVTKTVQMDINQLNLAIETCRTEAIKHNQTRHRIEEVTLPTLKRTLAAFRTPVLPMFEDTDRSVVLQH